MTPSYGIHPVTKDDYPPYNKPGSIKYWLEEIVKKLGIDHPLSKLSEEQMRAVIPETNIIILDPDM
jgi:hypothetical protein